MSEKKLNENCIKCGNNKAYYKYVGDSIAIVKTLDGDSKTFYSKAKEEILILTCDRCGYQWVEQPLATKSDNYANKEDKQ